MSEKSSTIDSLVGGSRKVRKAQAAVRYVTQCIAETVTHVLERVSPMGSMHYYQMLEETMAQP